MADSRISHAQRISMQIVAEREILRYKGDHAAWHKHVHGVDLDPMQILKMLEMDKHPYTIDFSSRRTGKTAVKELYLLEFNACNQDQELGIVAPREAQSLVNLGYHLDAIRRSPILSAYIGTRANRPTIADSYYQFVNRSKARAYGIMAQVDGGDMTTASLEEVDDMPKDRLYGRFLLMMASTRRLGASKEARNDPQVRITGVFKGADTLGELISGGKYESLPTIDVHLGVRMGIVEAKFIDQMRGELSDDEYIRQLLCQNISSRNFIWQAHVRAAMQRGLKTGIEFVEPMPESTYRKRGVISFGFDAGGHGSKASSSKPALVVTEQVGSYFFFIYCRQWHAGADDTQVKNDLVALWRYFMPDVAWGDAYGVGMLTALNDDLLAQNLTTIDRRMIGDGESTAHTWTEWAFKPVRFDGMAKHQMATGLRMVFHSGYAVVPYFSDDDDSLKNESVQALRLLTQQLANIKQLPTQEAYSSYDTVSNKLGDDLFDAAMASVWGHIRRAAPLAAPVILTSTRDVRNLVYQR